MGFEALSRGASEVIMVDISRRSIKTILKNADTLGVKDRIKVMQVDFRKALEMFADAPPDFVFLDPPLQRRIRCRSAETDRAFLSFQKGHDLGSKHELKDIETFLPFETRCYGDIWLWIFVKRS